MTDTAPAPDATPAATSAPTAAPAGEEGELLALHAKDPQVFEHTPNWRGTDKTAAQRLVEIRKERAAAEQPEAQQETDAADDGIEVDAIDLDAPGDDEGEEASEPAAVDPDLQWGRGDFTWTPPDGAEVTETGQQRIDAFAEFAHRANMPPEAFEGAINFYNDFAAKEQARLAELDKTASNERAAALTERLGSKEAYDAYAATAREAAKLMPASLRDALKAARLPDGRKVAHMPELIDFLHQVAGRQGQATHQAQPRDSRSMMQQELAEIDALMNRDIDEYHRPWRTSGVSASERRLQIARELGSEGPARPSAGDLRAEEQELVRLSRTDPDTFRFGGPPGQTPADRLHAIRMGRG